MPGSWAEHLGTTNPQTAHAHTCSLSQCQHFCYLQRVPPDSATFWDSSAFISPPAERASFPLDTVTFSLLLHFGNSSTYLQKNFHLLPFLAKF